MATLFSLANKTFHAGAILSNRQVTLPVGVVAFTYTVTIGDPTVDPPTDENATAWVECNDNGVWREISRFVATCSSASTGRVELRGSGLRVSASCGQTTLVSLTVETSA
jgi:hypothetical protein